MNFKHQSVLLKETIASLNLQSGGLYVDGTLGGGGHSQAILEATAPDGCLLGLDRDDDALAAATARLQEFGERFKPIKANFADMAQVLATENISEVDGVLLDIGVSSYQLDEPTRGFSYMQDGPLDMRLDRRDGQTVAELLAVIDETELANIIYRYGEEKFSRRIARRIVEERERQPLNSTVQLAELVASAIPAAKRRQEKQHPAKRTFQALRIAVNDELGVITFHSLEDRIVKTYFASLARGCECPPEFPVCVCGKKPQGRLLQRKPQTAAAEELADNPRARSAKLRTIEKI